MTGVAQEHDRIPSSESFESRPRERSELFPLAFGDLRESGLDAWIVVLKLRQQLNGNAKQTLVASLAERMWTNLEM